MIEPNEIKKAREKAGETMAQFATRFGVDRSTVCNWESGKRCMNPSAQILFQNAFGKVAGSRSRPR